MALLSFSACYLEASILLLRWGILPLLQGQAHLVPSSCSPRWHLKCRSTYPWPCITYPWTPQVLIVPWRAQLTTFIFHWWVVYWMGAICIFITFYLIIILVHVYVYGHMCMMECACGGQSSICRGGFYHVTSRYWTQVLRLGGKCIYLLTGTIGYKVKEFSFDFSGWIRNRILIIHTVGNIDKLSTFSSLIGDKECVWGWGGGGDQKALLLSSVFFFF